MKKIIIACNHFAPDNMIAAVRITKFAKYFSQHGYHVTVIAEQKYDFIEDEILKKDAEGIKVLRGDNSICMKKFLRCYKKIILPIKKGKYNNLDNRVRMNRKTGKYEFYPFETAYPIIGSIEYIVEMARQYDLFKSVKKHLEQEEDLDYIFTSYGDYFSIFVGSFLHRKYANVPWIFDVRDAICRYKFTPQCVRWIAKAFERYIWKEADAIIGVSKGICRHVPGKYRGKTHCVTNGYDREDRQGIVENKRNDHKMRFAYTGAMYGGIRNLSPVFESIRKLIDERNIDSDIVEFLYAGKESAYEIFKSQAKKYGLDDNCIYYGNVMRKESLKLQMESDILLVSSFDYQTDIGGVITGKALEYMSADRPIIAIINGDVEHSELAEIIRSANLGFAYEEAHHQKDGNELYLYLSAKFKELKETGNLSHKPDEEILRKYDYKNLCKRMLKILESIH